MNSEGVHLAGGEGQLFSSIQKLGTCNEHCVKPWPSHWKKCHWHTWSELHRRLQRQRGPHCEKLLRCWEKCVFSLEKPSTMIAIYSWVMGRSRGAGATFSSGVHRKRVMGKRCQLHKGNTDWIKGAQHSQGSGQAVAQTVQRVCGFASSRAIQECVQEPWVTWPCFTVLSALSKGWIK